MKKVLAIAATLLATSAFADNQVVLTTSAVSQKGEQASVGMDIIASSAWKGFQFDLDVSGATSLDLSGCLTNISKTLTVSCKEISKGKVRVFAVDINSVGTEMKSGQASIGVIKYSGTPSLEVSNLEFADKNGEVIPSSVVTSK